jgi:hypothetical protein
MKDGKGLDEIRFATAIGTDDDIQGPKNQFVGAWPERQEVGQRDFVEHSLISSLRPCQKTGTNQLESGILPGTLSGPQTAAESFLVLFPEESGPLGNVVFGGHDGAKRRPGFFHLCDAFGLVAIGGEIGLRRHKPDVGS